MKGPAYLFHKYLVNKRDEAEDEVEQLRNESGSSGNLLVAEEILDVLNDVLETFENGFDIEG